MIRTQLSKIVYLVELERLSIKVERNNYLV